MLAWCQPPMTSSNEKIKRDLSNIFHRVYTRDTPYVVMQRINNKQVWKVEWEQKNKGVLQE